ncbi:MAG: DoxX family protein [Planctomycetota bacterium]
MDRSRQDLARLLIRLMLGIVFVFHGAQKLFGAFDGPGLSNFSGWLTGMGVPMPGVSAFLAACAEFFGGLCLILGWFFPLVIVPMAFTMAVAVFAAHWANGFWNADPTKPGYEFPLTLGVMLVALGMLGPGSIRAPLPIKPKAKEKPQG